MNANNENQDEKYSTYGKYDVSEKLKLVLPKTQISIERRSENLTSYYRKNSENQEVRKSVPQSSENIKIELCPILPLHLPDKKTNDMIFLRIAEPVYVEKKSTSSILIQFPIEIGVFIINQSDGSKELFDCFTCEPMHSRFALYGTPEEGNLCMYSKVNLLEKGDPDPYVFVRMNVTLTNDLEKSASIGKIVFPITNHTIYYLDGTSEAYIDDTKCVIREDVQDIIVISHEEYSRKDRDWNIVSYSNTKYEMPFIMYKGFD